MAYTTYKQLPSSTPIFFAVESAKFPNYHFTIHQFLSWSDWWKGYCYFPRFWVVRMIVTVTRLATRQPYYFMDRLAKHLYAFIHFYIHTWKTAHRLSPLTHSNVRRMFSHPSSLWVRIWNKTMIRQAIPPSYQRIPSILPVRIYPFKQIFRYVYSCSVCSVSI